MSLAVVGVWLESDDLATDSCGAAVGWVDALELATTRARVVFRSDFSLVGWVEDRTSGRLELEFRLGDED